MKTITHREVVKRLREHIDLIYGSQAEAALSLGMDEGQLSRILNGKNLPPQRLLDVIDIKRTTVVKYVYEEAQ